MNENVDALPRRLYDLGVRFNKEQEEELRIELREVYYRYYGASMGQIDPLQVIREAFVLVSRMHLRLPTRFALLDKALATLGSVGTELYPDFNVFEVAEPYAAELVARRYSPRHLLDRSKEELESYGGLLMELPYQVHDTLEQLRDGEVEVQFRHKGLDDLTRQADVVFNRLVVAVVMSALADRLVADRDLGAGRLAHLRHPRPRAGGIPLGDGARRGARALDRAQRPAVGVGARHRRSAACQNAATRRLNGSPRSCGWWAAPGKTASSAPSRRTSRSQTAMKARPPISCARRGTASQPPRATRTGNGAGRERGERDVGLDAAVRSPIERRTERRATSFSGRAVAHVEPPRSQEPAQVLLLGHAGPVARCGAFSRSTICSDRRIAPHEPERRRLDQRERAHRLPAAGRPRACTRWRRRSARARAPAGRAARARSSASGSKSTRPAPSGLRPNPRRSTTCSSNSAASGRCSEKASAPKLMLPCTSSAAGPDPMTLTCRSGMAGFKHAPCSSDVRTPP